MKKYIVILTEAERTQLQEMITKGKAAARKQTHARILLKADRSPNGDEWTDEAIGQAVEVTPRMVAHVRQAFVEEGLEIALAGHSTANHRGRKLDGDCEAHLVALVCQPPPPGHARWALRLLADKLVELDLIESVSHETVRKTLAANELKPWKKKEWCIPPTQSGEFVYHMEDILDVYKRPECSQYPLVCVDELSQQLVSETRVPLPIESGKPKRYDYEYKREGTANLFMIFAPLLGKRWIQVTSRRTYQDWAYVMRDLVDVYFPHALTITLVVDNLNIHGAGALYEAFPPEEAKRILSKLEIHNTPKHGSWLNMAEIELSTLHNQCLDRRIGSLVMLKREVTAWQNERNEMKARVNWRFTTTDARIKLKRLYPVVQPIDSSTPGHPAPAAMKTRQVNHRSPSDRCVLHHRKDEA